MRHLTPLGRLAEYGTWQARGVEGPPSTNDGTGLPDGWGEGGVPSWTDQNDWNTSDALDSRGFTNQNDWDGLGVSGTYGDDGNAGDLYVGVSHQDVQQQHRVLGDPRRQPLTRSQQNAVKEAKEFLRQANWRINNNGIVTPPRGRGLRSNSAANRRPDTYRRMVDLADSINRATREGWHQDVANQLIEASARFGGLGGRGGTTAAQSIEFVNSMSQNLVQSGVKAATVHTLKTLANMGLRFTTGGGRGNYSAAMRDFLRDWSRKEAGAYRRLNTAERIALRRIAGDAGVVGANSAGSLIGQVLDVVDHPDGILGEITGYPDSPPDIPSNIVDQRSWAFNRMLNGHTVRSGGNTYRLQPVRGGSYEVQVRQDGQWESIGDTDGRRGFGPVVIQAIGLSGEGGSGQGKSGKGPEGEGARVKGRHIILPNGRRVRNNKRNRDRYLGMETVTTKKGTVLAETNSPLTRTDRGEKRLRRLQRILKKRGKLGPRHTEELEGLLRANPAGTRYDKRGRIVEAGGLDKDQERQLLRLSRRAERGKLGKKARRQLRKLERLQAAAEPNRTQTKKQRRRERLAADTPRVRRALRPAQTKKQARRAQRRLEQQRPITRRVQTKKQLRRQQRREEQRLTRRAISRGVSKKQARRQARRVAQVQVRQQNRRRPVRRVARRVQPPPRNRRERKSAQVRRRVRAAPAPAPTRRRRKKAAAKRKPAPVLVNHRRPKKRVKVRMRVRPQPRPQPKPRPQRRPRRRPLPPPPPPRNRRRQNKRAQARKPVPPPRNHRREEKRKKGRRRRGRRR